MRWVSQGSYQLTRANCPKQLRKLAELTVQSLSVENGIPTRGCTLFCATNPNGTNKLHFINVRERQES